jgi:HD-GYP domain-containing protein (c-di-GMP phosphodiesterase class II)
MSIRRLFLNLVVSMSLLGMIILGFQAVTTVRMETEHLFQRGNLLAEETRLQLRRLGERALPQVALLASGNPLETEHLLPDLKILAVVEENRVTRVIRGALVPGIELPKELFSARRGDGFSGWVISPLLDPRGELLLVTEVFWRNTPYLLAIRPNFDDLSILTGPSLVPLLIRTDGRVIWRAPRESVHPLGNAVADRGILERKLLGSEGWHFVPFPSVGEALWIRVEPLDVEGFAAAVILPFSAVLGALFRALVPSLLLFVLLGGVLLFFLHLWRNSFRPQILRLEGLLRQVRQQLERTRTSEELALAIERTGEAVARQRERVTFQEIASVLDTIAEVFGVIAGQQEEINAFHEEVHAMNVSLTETNDALRERERVWGKTLEVAQTVSRSGDMVPEMKRIAETILEVGHASGVIIDRLEEDTLFPVAWAGYDRTLLLAPVALSKSLVGRAVRTGEPHWIEQVDEDEEYVAVAEGITSEVVMPLLQGGEPVGGLTMSFARFRGKDRELLDTLVPVASALAGFLYMERAQREIKESYHYLVEKLQELTALYHDETAEHLQRMGAYCRMLAEVLGRSPEEQEEMFFLARVHDLGKLRVPRELLAKPGPLTAEEFEIVKEHARAGAEILGDARWLSMARTICASHHERWDGSGYPNGLKEMEIPWEGCVVALADVYDALRSPRAYKPELPHETVRRIILEGDGRVRPEHFHPRLLDFFREHSDRFAAIYDSARE